MTRSVDRYLNRVPSATRSQEKFAAFLTAILDEFVATQNVIDSLPFEFDIDNAVGVQLDAVGERIGFSRYLTAPIVGVYFELDGLGVGLDEGILLGPLDSTDGITRLDDGTYRLLLKIKARANTWDGSLEDAQKILDAISGNGTYVFIQDRFDLSFVLGVGGIVPSKLFVAILKQMKEWLKPGGVRLPTVYVTSSSGAPVFGLDVQNNYIGGLDSGAIALEY